MSLPGFDNSLQLPGFVDPEELKRLQQSQPAPWSGLTGPMGTGSNYGGSPYVGAGGATTGGALPPSPTPTAPAATSPQPGPNWVLVNGGWVPPDHPLALSGSVPPAGSPAPGASPGTGGAGTAGGTGSTGTTPGSPLPAGSGVTVPSLTIPPPPGSTPGIDIPPPPVVPPVTPATPPTATVAESPYNDLLRMTLLGYLADANAPVDLNDPSLRLQTDAYRVAQERSRRQGLEAEAARLGAMGLSDSGALDIARRQGFEGMGRDVAAFEAGLIGQETQNKQAQTEQALKLLTTLKTEGDQQSVALAIANLDSATKTELANLNAELEMAGMTAQERLAIMDAELKQYGIDVAGDLQKLELILGQEFNAAQLQLQGQIANLDAGVKMQIAQLDAQLRREGYSTQERLAAIDAEVRRYGIQTQGDLGNLDVALRRELGLGQLQLGLVNTLLGNQFNYDQLGWQMALQELLGNQGLMESLY